MLSSVESVIRPSLGADAASRRLSRRMTSSRPGRPDAVLPSKNSSHRSVTAMYRRRGFTEPIIVPSERTPTTSANAAFRATDTDPTSARVAISTCSPGARNGAATSKTCRTRFSFTESSRFSGQSREPVPEGLVGGCQARPISAVDKRHRVAPPNTNGSYEQVERSFTTAHPAGHKASREAIPSRNKRSISLTLSHTNNPDGDHTEPDFRPPATESYETSLAQRRRSSYAPESGDES
jgi:hypothetical protein